MEYLYLAVALLAGATKGYCGKKSSAAISGWQGATAANLIRMVMCIALSLLVVAADGQWDQLLVSGRTLGIYALSGVTMAIFLVTWMLGVRTSAFLLMSVFLMLGMIVPMLLGKLCYRETVGGGQWLGFCLMLIATGLLCVHNNAIKKKLTVRSFLLLLICGVANGLNGFLQKVFQREVPGGAVSVLNFYTYLIAGVCLLLFLTASHAMQAVRRESWRPIVGYMLVMALCLYLNSYFMTMAAAAIPASILYPMSQGAGLILSGLMSATLFGEKLSGKAVAGLLMAFAGLLAMKML